MLWHWRRGGPAAIGDQGSTETGATRGEYGECGCGPAQVLARGCYLAGVDGDYDGVVRKGQVWGINNWYSV